MDIQLFFTTFPYTLVLPCAVLLTLIISIYSLIVSLRAKRRISKLLGGKNSKDIDEVLVHIYNNISTLEQFKSKTTTELELMTSKLQRSIQSVETIRFNPFKGTGAGGNQSFVTTLIDEKGDGVIISSLYASDRMSIFAKPVSSFTSTFELTEEEKDTLDKATQKVNNIAKKA